MPLNNERTEVRSRSVGAVTGGTNARVPGTGTCAGASAGAATTEGVPGAFAPSGESAEPCA